MPGRLCLLGMVVMTVGCATARFKVPAEEVQRLAQLPASERGKEVRVIPWKSPTGDLSPDQAAPTYQQPEAGEPNMVAQINFEPNFDLPAPRGHRRGPRPFARPVAHPPNPGNGAFRGVPVPSPGSPSGHGPVRTSRAPALPGGLGSGRGGGGKEVVAVVAAVAVVVAVVALAAVIANASAKAEARARFARTYDGWVAVGGDHVLHLNYGPKVNRMIPLSQLTAEDTVGLRFGYLKNETNGQVTPLPLPPVYAPWPPQPPAPRAPPPAPAPPLPPTAPGPAPLAPENSMPPRPGRAPEHPDLVS